MRTVHPSWTQLRGRACIDPDFLGAPGGFGVRVAVRAFMPSFLYSKAHVAGTFFPLSIALGVKTGGILARVTGFMGPWGSRFGQGCTSFGEVLVNLFSGCLVCWPGGDRSVSLAVTHAGSTELQQSTTGEKHGRKKHETSRSPLQVFLVSKHSLWRCWGCHLWYLWIGRARHPGAEDGSTGIEVLKCGRLAYARRLCS